MDRQYEQPAEGGPSVSPQDTVSEGSSPDTTDAAPTDPESPTDDSDLSHDVYEHKRQGSPDKSLADCVLDFKSEHSYGKGREMRRSLYLGSIEEIPAGYESDHDATANTSAASDLNQSENLAGQLQELQTMVTDMKCSFGSALEALSAVQLGDAELKAQVDSSNQHCEQQIQDLTSMVFSLKNEFATLIGHVQHATSGQRALQQRVTGLQVQRDILLEELDGAGLLDDNTKSKYHSGQERPPNMNRSPGAPLSVLLETAGQTYSDQDSGVTTAVGGELSSCGEITPPRPPVVSPLVQSYIAGLQSQPLDEPLEDDYDSDSSLTAAANKSLDMSRSLGNCCGDLTRPELSGDEEGGPSDTEDAAEDIGSATRDYGIHKSPGSSRKPPHERSPKDVLRNRVAGEILDTERKYCLNLWTILDHFVEPMKQQSLASVKDINVMFPPCLWHIYEQHCIFLQRLEERLSNWRWQGVLGDVFARFFDSNNSDLLTQYQTYVNEFPNALHHIRKACRHSKFRKYLRQQQLDPICENLDIASFLLTPVQRVPRYVLLLKQLLRYTEPEHPDHFYIDMSLSRLGTFLSDLNDSIAFSMKVVSGEATPKPPKRRLRVGSLLSSSLGSYDAARAGFRTAMRQAGGNRTQVYSQRCPRPQLDPSYPRMGATYPGPSNSRTFATPANPYPSGCVGDVSQLSSASLCEQDSSLSLCESSMEHVSHETSMLLQVPQRSLSKQPSSGYLSASESFHSHGSWAVPLTAVAGQARLPGGSAQAGMAAEPNLSGSVGYEGAIHHSMLHIDDKYGVYGHSEDSEASFYEATSASELSQQDGRWHSYGDQLHKDPLSQRQIALSLASSLQATPHHQPPRGTYDLSTPTATLMRPKSEAAMLPPSSSRRMKPPRPKSASVDPCIDHSLLDCSMGPPSNNHSMLSNTLNSSQVSTASKARRLLARWGKENRDLDSTVDNKKRSFKMKSIKNLFKKRSSKTMQPTAAVTPLQPHTNRLQVQTPEPLDGTLNASDLGHVTLNASDLGHLMLDHSGDPCSAV